MSSGSYKSICTGSSQITGISTNRTFGSDSSRVPVLMLHLQPSIKRPWIFTPFSGSSVTYSLKYGLISALNIKVSIAMRVLLAYDCIAAVIKP